MEGFAKIEGFEWDEGNKDKNFKKHKVSNGECEEVFFDEYKKILKDAIHSGAEDRYILIGKTTNGRILFTVFMIRNNMIRVISARDLKKKEQKIYGE